MDLGARHHLLHQLVAHLALGYLPGRLLKLLANLVAQRGEICDIGDLLRELVVQLGHLLRLECLDGDLKGDVLAGQDGILEVIGEMNRHLARLANPGALDSHIEGRNHIGLVHIESDIGLRPLLQVALAPVEV